MKNAIFKTTKPTGVLAVTLVKGGIPYTLPGIPNTFRTKLYQATFLAGHYLYIDEAEEVVVANELTSEGKKYKVVDLLRAKIKEGGSGIEEVTEDDIKKSRLVNVDSKALVKAYAEMIKTKNELRALSKDKLKKYIDSLEVLGYDIGKLSELRKDPDTTKDDLVESIMKITNPEEVIEELSGE